MMVDDAVIKAARAKLYAAVLSDVLDAQGYRHQVLPPRIRPLDDELVLVGRARTGLYRDVYHVPRGHNPYELEIALIDDLKPGDVPVLGCGASGRIAPWGELLTTASQARGANGCLTDGLVRDIKAVRALRFPVFHADGVLVVPQPIVKQTLKLALEKIEGEDRTREELQQGARLAEVFKKYGVL
jgi:4-hydroxy-4-methyl-2-oxoglutarate aldolase